MVEETEELMELYMNLEVNKESKAEDISNQFIIAGKDPSITSSIMLEDFYVLLAQQPPAARGTTAHGSFLCC